MKKLTFVFLLSFPALLFGQVDDRTENGCDGTARSVYQVGDEGKPLLIASDGLDCSICMNHAPDVRNFANDNQGTIEVWGAMSYLYSNAIPTCANVEQWNTAYNWTTIFTFVDLDEFWPLRASRPIT